MGKDIQIEYLELKEHIIQQYGSYDAEYYVAIIDTRLHKWLDIYMPFRVKLTDDSPLFETHSSCTKWCEENLKDKFLIRATFFSYSNNLAYFKLKEDAFHFKLTWG